MEGNGFGILEFEPNGNFFEYVAQELRRIPYVAERYAALNMTYLEHLAKRLMLRMLERFSTSDRQSDELLCFGYHVLARKQQ